MTTTLPAPLSTYRAPPTYSRDVLGFALLFAQLAFTVWIIPDWSPSHLAEPPFLAGISGIAVTLAILMLRFTGRRGSRLERGVLAVFLGGMPLIYVASWLLAPQPGWLAIELLAVPVFGTLAVLGVRRSPWFLAAGIAAHGLAWDLWHHGRTTFIPDWYVVGCCGVDLALAAYVALEVPRFLRNGAPDRELAA